MFLYKTIYNKNTNGTQNAVFYNRYFNRIFRENFKLNYDIFKLVESFNEVSTYPFIFNYSSSEKINSSAGFTTCLYSFFFG